MRLQTWPKFKGAGQRWRHGYYVGSGDEGGREAKYEIGKAFRDAHNGPPIAHSLVPPPPLYIQIASSYSTTLPPLRVRYTRRLSPSDPFDFGFPQLPNRGFHHIAFLISHHLRSLPQ